MNKIPIKYIYTILTPDKNASMSTVSHEVYFKEEQSGIWVLSLVFKKTKQTESESAIWSHYEC